MVQERLKASDNEKDSANKEVINLKNELMVLQGSFAKIDAEKDSLLVSFCMINNFYALILIL